MFGLWCFIKHHKHFKHFYIQIMVEIMFINFTHKNKSHSIATINSPYFINFPKTYLLSCSHTLQISVKLHFPKTQVEFSQTVLKLVWQKLCKQHQWDCYSLETPLCGKKKYVLVRLSLNWCLQVCVLQIVMMWGLTRVGCGRWDKRLAWETISLIS